ncbi:MAG: SpoIIE family protein phosphatase [Polyangiaceae bacterium]
MDIAFSIRQKLAFAAGIPVLGAVILAMQIVGSAREEARRAESLGSVESLAELSADITRVLHALELERAEVALGSGLENKRIEEGGAAQPLQAHFDKTDADLAALQTFLRLHQSSDLPRRLAAALQDTNAPLQKLPEFRKKLTTGKANLGEILDQYGVITHALVKATAALTDLSDDGQFLRLITSLVALLDLDERSSEEHALLSHVFAVGEFPPGSYRRLVTIVSEQETYNGVFRTLAAVEHQQMYDGVQREAVFKDSERLRKLALESTDEKLAQDPKAYFDIGEKRLELLRKIETLLDGQIRSTVLSKIADVQKRLTLSVSLAASVVLSSLLFAWIIARNVTRRVDQLRDASRRIGQGDLGVRVRISSHDELGQLGGSFNDMVGELERARGQLSNQARMARELEIAATIQRAMLPPQPSHPDFEFAGKMVPADEVGGDFYDVLTRPDGDLWITVGDVSGHGVGAGLVMLMTQVAFASHFLMDATLSSEVVLSDVNRLLCENIGQRLHDDKYVTVQLLKYAGAGRFLCVGGHVWPIVYRAKTGQCDVIRTPGPWLGILPSLGKIPESIIELDPGDVLCLYSDGLSEARDAKGELFDTDRLAASLAKAVAREESLAKVPEAVFADVEEFSDRHDDDWTMLLIRRTTAARPPNQG